MELAIKIDAKAKNWLKNKGTPITISRLEINNCCVPIEEVQVSFLEPINGKYHQYHEEDLTIFVESVLEFKNNQLELKLSGFVPFQSIQVSGLQRF